MNERFAHIPQKKVLRLVAATAALLWSGEQVHQNISHSQQTEQNPANHLVLRQMPQYVMDGWKVVPIENVQKVEGKRPFNGVLHMEYEISLDEKEIKWKAYTETITGAEVFVQWGLRRPGEPGNFKEFMMDTSCNRIGICKPFYLKELPLEPKFINAQPFLRLSKRYNNGNNYDFLITPMYIYKVGDEKKGINLVSNVYPTGYETKAKLIIPEGVFGEGKKGIVLFSLSLAGFSTEGRVDKKSPPLVVALSKEPVKDLTLVLPYPEGTVVRRMVDGEWTGEIYIVRRNKINIPGNGVYEPVLKAQ